MIEKKNLDRKEMFSIYIDTINYERKTEYRKVTNNSKYIKKLFATFGINIISETITKNWLQKLNLGFMGYFSEETITTQHLQNCLDFFRNNIKSNMEIIQTELHKNVMIFNYVNFTTTDADTFFCSLIKQFLFIVKPSIMNDRVLTDFIANIETTKTNETISTSVVESGLQNSDTKMKLLFSNAIVDFKIAYYINNLQSLMDSLYPSQTIVQPTLYEHLKEDGLLHFECYFPSYELHRPNVTYISKTNDNIENFSTNVNAFLQYIHSEIIDIFIPCQDETTYKLIKEFCESLKNFDHFFGMLDPNLAKEFSAIYSQFKNVDFLCSKCQEELNKIENNIIEMQKTDSTEEIKESLHNLKKRKMKLDFLLSFLSQHVEICSLFEKITDEKSLLAHTEY